MSNFSCSPTRNITSHSMKNVAFHSLLKGKMIILPILTTALVHLLRWWEILFELKSDRLTALVTLRAWVRHLWPLSFRVDIWAKKSTPTWLSVRLGLLFNQPRLTKPWHEFDPELTHTRSFPFEWWCPQGRLDRIKHSPTENSTNESTIEILIAFSSDYIAGGVHQFGRRSARNWRFVRDQNPTRKIRHAGGVRSGELSKCWWHGFACGEPEWGGGIGGGRVRGVEWRWAGVRGRENNVEGE